MLGYQRFGSELITTPANLSILISASTAFKDVPEASGEALRCVANGLLLVEGARSTWVKKEVGGGEATVESLEVSVTSTTPIFYSPVDRNRQHRNKHLWRQGCCSSVRHPQPQVLDS